MAQGKTDRYNEGKLQYDLIPWQWLKSLANIFTFGAKKYSPNNWQNSLNTDDHDQVIEDRIGSLMRHYVAYRSGEIYDPESGEHHLSHVSWNALLIMWYDLNKDEHSLPFLTEEEVEEVTQKVQEVKYEGRVKSVK